MRKTQLPDRFVYPIPGHAVAAGHLSEAELLIKIGSLASSPLGFDEAIERIAGLLEGERGLSGLVVLDKRDAGASVLARHGEDGAPPDRIVSLPVRDGDAEIAELRIAFRIAPSNRAQSLVLAAFVAEQIGALLAKRRLSEKRARLTAVLARMRQELATVKVVSRAVGLLVSKHQSSEPAARNWLELQSRNTGLPLHAVADRLVAAESSSGSDFTLRRETA